MNWPPSPHLGAFFDDLQERTRVRILLVGRRERRIVAKTSRHRTVEKMAADHLDLPFLKRHGMLGDSWIKFVPMLGFRSVTKIQACRHGVVRDREDPQQIRVSWTRCQLGGARPWLHCSCGRRTERLFKDVDGYYCRQCFHSLRYASQTKSTQGRLHFEACKLRLRLGGIASLTAPFPKRPRGMHTKTYERLRRRAEGLEARISPRVRMRPTDYPNLIYYSPPLTSKEFRRPQRRFR